MIYPEDLREVEANIRAVVAEELQRVLDERGEVIVKRDKVRDATDTNIILAFAEIKNFVDYVASDSRHRQWSADEVQLAEHIQKIISRQFGESSDS